MELVRTTPDATIALEQASSSLPCGRRPVVMLGTVALLLSFNQT